MQLDSPRFKNFIIPAGCLLLVEIFCFGIFLKSIGVYQDEWIYFGEFHFTPHNLISLLKVGFCDPRLIVRPLEVLHFPVVFYFVWEKPLIYHFINLIFEFFGAWFLFLFLLRLRAKKSVALAAAIIYLLYPTHDSTHYSIVASSITISMALYLLSLWLYACACSKNSKLYLLWSTIAFAGSVYNYELCLPLVLVFPIVHYLVDGKTQRTANRWQNYLLFWCPCLAVALSMVVYRAWLLPLLGLGYRYKTCFNLQHFIDVILSGFNVSVSPATLSFCWSMIIQKMRAGISVKEWLYLITLFSGLFGTLTLTGEKTAPSAVKPSLLVGSAILVLAYTIYGFSPEHCPAINAWLNRVNMSASLGASIILVSLLFFGITKLPIDSSKVKDAIYAGTVTVLSLLMVIVNWEFAGPWTVSYACQKELQKIIKQNAQMIARNDSVILATRIRWLWEAPVYDGTWDFQDTMQIVLNNPHIKGTVITERLHIVGDSLVDNYQDCLLGVFPFKHMLLCAPPFLFCNSPSNSRMWIPINSKEEFFKYVKLGPPNVPSAFKDNLNCTCNHITKYLRTSAR